MIRRRDISKHIAITGATYDPDTTEFLLDDEQRARVGDCLLKADLVLPAAAFEHFVRDIEGSILRFHVASPTATLREAHDALRSVWRLAHQDGPSIGLLRIRVKALPEGAIAYVNGRAKRLITRLFPGDSADTGFLAWAERADGEKLVRALQILTAEGGKLADRSRGRGKRSQSHLEPMIFGKVRGIGAKKCKGGRPSKDAQHELVMNLALDWTSATGNPPEPGRSDRTGFGDLAHSVFQWLLPEEQAAGAASYALRWHWSEVKKAHSVP